MNSISVFPMTVVAVNHQNCLLNVSANIFKVISRAERKIRLSWHLEILLPGEEHRSSRLKTINFNQICMQSVSNHCKTFMPSVWIMYIIHKVHYDHLIFFSSILRHSCVFVLQQFIMNFNANLNAYWLRTLWACKYHTEYVLGPPLIECIPIVLQNN